MVMIQINNDDLFQLRLFLEFIDPKLASINSDIQKSSDPDTDGLCDKTEYFLGFGFIAIQRYINATCSNTEIDKNLALNKNSVVEALNAGANYFKHEPEWPFTINIGEPDDDMFYPISIDRSGQSLNEIQKRTFKKITKVTPYAEYTLSNLLAEVKEQLSLDKTLSFTPLLEHLEVWSDKLLNLK